MRVNLRLGSEAIHRRTRLAFRQDRWDAMHRLACARAFREVPFYREQWAYARRELSEPLAVTAGELQRELFRLCPLRSQWDPRREPTLWTGESGPTINIGCLLRHQERALPTQPPSWREGSRVYERAKPANPATTMIGAITPRR